MKKLLFTQILFASTILLLVSCSGDVPNPTIPSVPVIKKTVSVQDTISLNKFNTWTQSWKSNGPTFNATSLMEYFTMPKVDVTEVLGENPTEVRYYLGLDMSVTPNEAHLILVGVDDKGQNMLDYGNSQYAYDLTKPCPKYCPQK